ncbi:hypothetical protein RZN05_16920 [Sphingomonas sp. HF-S4]|uniref:Uncharacterized protein n=1 Tax=Sphingomonas agrestis TaxID=3080540 RepID=A0ABU3YBB2_9SPHN|nr:hypothetical protein [Sphingomonas sp. HF-S4]MDV3458683.1 hypothetical protein [Sphingomonas sp. HF-S4]
MKLVQIDPSEIVELDTQVAMHGAVRATEVAAADDLFELLVGIAVLIYELAPGG